MSEDRAADTTEKDGIEPGKFRRQYERAKARLDWQIPARSAIVLTRPLVPPKRPSRPGTEGGA